MISLLAVVSAVCAVAPATVFCVNLGHYRQPGPARFAEPTRVSVLIPARDEEGGIGAAVLAALESTGVEFEIVVMDDGSTDHTAQIVEEIGRGDGRVRLERAPGLPSGWNGKQHACWALAATARYEVMCFVDADVRLRPEALARMAELLVTGQNGLVSGFPLEETATWMEWMLLPLIHFVLLGFLPIWMMRKSTNPGYAAGCGQFLMVQRDAYFACGGHSEIRATMHDGLLLPRLFRRAGCRTDLADLTPWASCRMYRNAAQVWSGLAKNATEGIADPVRIGPASVFLLAGQVLPFLLAFWLGRVSLWVDGAIVAGMIAAWLPRALGVVQFRQDWRGALLHPLGIVLLLAVQWYALGRKLTGGAVSWKARAYAGD